MSECKICGATENLQSHHVSYNPEVKQVICVNCHRKIHRSHGVGAGRGHRSSNLRNFKDTFIKIWRKEKRPYQKLMAKFKISSTTVYNWSKKLGLQRKLKKRFHPPKLFNPSRRYEKYTKEQLGLMLELPDHLRRTYTTILDLGGKGSASDIRDKTELTRVLESNYLNQLVLMGYLTKRKQGKLTVFEVAEK